MSHIDGGEALMIINYDGKRDEKYFKNVRNI